jgi:hypothetical protein
MYNCIYCQECGGKLVSAFFCHGCEMAFCSPACLADHVRQHAAVKLSAPVPRTAAAIKTPVANGVLAGAPPGPPA